MRFYYRVAPIRSHGAINVITGLWVQSKLGLMAAKERAPIASSKRTMISWSNIW